MNWKDKASVEAAFPEGKVIRVQVSEVPKRTVRGVCIGRVQAMPSGPNGRQYRPLVKLPGGFILDIPPSNIAEES